MESWLSEPSRAASRSSRRGQSKSAPYVGMPPNVPANATIAVGTSRRESFFLGYLSTMHKGHRLVGSAWFFTIRRACRPICQILRYVCFSDSSQPARLVSVSPFRPAARLPSRPFVLLLRSLMSWPHVHLPCSCSCCSCCYRRVCVRSCCEYLCFVLYCACARMPRFVLVPHVFGARVLCWGWRVSRLPRRERESRVCLCLCIVYLSSVSTCVHVTCRVRRAVLCGVLCPLSVSVCPCAPRRHGHGA